MKIKITLLISIISWLLLSCNNNNTLKIEEESSYNIQTDLAKLDSLGFDITNDSLLFELGFQGLLYFGKNEEGNALIEYALSMRDTITAEDYRHWSTKNTKNGNYEIAINQLERAMEIDPQDVSGYYGWVLLYYYRDYKKALEVLTLHDAYTPGFDDAPMGEDINYLKGLCLMKLNLFDKANEEFNKYINNTELKYGEEWIDVYALVQNGRCLTELKKYEDALTSFKTAIKQYDNCTEAYFYMGLTHIEMNNKPAACLNFNSALDLINKGHKSYDPYVELFHEVYPLQIVAKINENCEIK